MIYILFIKGVRLFVLALLSVIYNTARVVGINCYFNQTDLKAIVEPYCKSKDLLININAKIIVALTRDKLTDEDFCIFQLSMEECQAIILALQEISTSNESAVMIVDYSFNAEELLFSLKHLLACEFNRHMVSQMEIVPFLISFLISANPAWQMLSCHIVLTLLTESEFKKVFLDQDLPLLEILEDLTKCSNEVKNIAICLLDELGYSDRGRLSIRSYTLQFQTIIIL